VNLSFLDNLSISQLRAELKKRKGKDYLVLGGMEEIRNELREVLKEEQRHAWQEREKRLPQQKIRLRRLLKEIRDEIGDFELANAFEWKKDFEVKGKWDWPSDVRSLAIQISRARKQYEMNLRARKRRAPKFVKEPSSEPTKNHDEEQMERKVCAWKARIKGSDFACFNNQAQNKSTCVYHVSSCMKCTEQVERANKAGKCSACLEKDGFPKIPQMARHKCPGVHQMTRSILSLLGYERQVENGTLLSFKSTSKCDNDLQCSWRHTNKRKIEFACQNSRLGESQFCGFHQTYCVARHPGGFAKIRIPNKLGFCEAHHVALMKEGPEVFKSVPGTCAMSNQTHSNEHPLRPKPKQSWSDTRRVSLMRKSNLFHGVSAVSVESEYSHSSDESTREDDSDGSDTEGVAITNVIRDKAVQLIVRKFPKSLQLIENARKEIKGRIRNNDKLKELRKEAEAKKKDLQKMILGRRAAKTIQRCFRGFQGRNKARELEKLWSFRHREKGALIIQGQFRRLCAMRLASKFRKELLVSSVMIQKYFRGHQARKVSIKHRSALRIQRLVRGFSSRREIAAMFIVIESRWDGQDEAWAWMLIVRCLKRFVKCWRIRRTKLLFWRRRIAAKSIQQVFRNFQTRSKILSIGSEVAQRKVENGIIILQKAARTFLSLRKVQAVKLRASLKAVIIIQAGWRGFRGRILANLRREEIEKAWQWLALNKSRKYYENMLPRSKYGIIDFEKAQPNLWLAKEKVRTKDLNFGMTLLSTQKEESQPIKEKPDSKRKLTWKAEVAERGRFRQAEERFKKLWSEEPFKSFDPCNTGRVLRFQFAAALRRMPYRMGEGQIRGLVKRWSTTEGTVSYSNFLAYVRQERTSCKVHRLWGCPFCLHHGQCTKCRCFQFRRTLSAPKSICSCGHCSHNHLIVPKTNISRVPGSTTTAMRKEELNHLLGPPPASEMPREVEGVAFKFNKSNEHSQQ